jgi:hypothetical protein
MKPDTAHEPLRDIFGDELDEVSRRGVAFYDEKLKAILEPEHNGKHVGVHLDSGNYVVERTSGEARRALRRRHPDGQLFFMYIGPADDDPMTARILGSQLLARRKAERAK